MAPGLSHLATVLTWRTTRGEFCASAAPEHQSTSSGNYEQTVNGDSTFRRLLRR